MFAEPPALPLCLNGKKNSCLLVPLLCPGFALCASPLFPGPCPHSVLRARPSSAGPGAGVGLIYLEEEEGRVEALVKTKKADEEQGSTRGWEMSPFFLGRSAPPLRGWASGLPSWALGVVF